jgi:predicted nucleotidyltransferase component of viral defense system
MTIIQDMLAKYDCRNATDYRNALKEIIQEVALCGLSHSGFFQIGAFYGGTALRIFHGLRRFSEDMDFSLISPSKDFDLEKYLSGMRQELAAVGLQMTVERKQKTKITPIQSAFIKGGTYVQVIHITGNEADTKGLTKDEVLKIKVEVDTDPPADASYEMKYALRPVPFAVRLYDKPSLFAGKTHAVLCRGWNNRVKGRDFYDYVWYLANNTPLNILHLQRRLEQSGRWNPNDVLTLPIVKDMLNERFAAIDYAAAKKDVIDFIRNPAELDVWSASFFSAITENLTATSLNA